MVQLAVQAGSTVSRETLLNVRGFCRGRVAPTDVSDVTELLHLPPLRNLPERRGDAGVVFVAGEAEVDEPLAVEGAGHRLQNPDAPLAVLDQLVVGRQDAGDAALHGQRGDFHRHFL